MKNVPGAIIIPSELKQQPRKHEIKAALALAKYFKADVEFVATSHHTSPDFLIKGTLWELKSPQGKGRNNIEHQLKSALRQSPNIILTLVDQRCIPRKLNEIHCTNSDL